MCNGGELKYELNELIGNADIVRFIGSRRIAWLGHVMRMDDKRTPKRILQWKPIGTRTRGRPQKRWIAGIEEDLQTRWRTFKHSRTPKTQSQTPNNRHTQIPLVHDIASLFY
jgi:hypothetical protein